MDRPSVISAPASSGRPASFRKVVKVYETLVSVSECMKADGMYHTSL
jgi:hypothetical protein